MSSHFPLAARAAMRVVSVAGGRWRAKVTNYTCQGPNHSPETDQKPLVSSDSGPVIEVRGDGVSIAASIGPKLAAKLASLSPDRLRGVLRAGLAVDRTRRWDKRADGTSNC
jgi:hypothetical protein